MLTNSFVGISDETPHSGQNTLYDPGETWEEKSSVERMHSLQKKWRFLQPMRLTPAVMWRWHRGHALSSDSCLSGEKSVETSRGTPKLQFRVSRSASEGAGDVIEMAERVAVGGGSAHSFDFRARRFPPLGRTSVLHSAGGTDGSAAAAEYFGTLEGGA